MEKLYKINIIKEIYSEVMIFLMKNFITIIILLLYVNYGLAQSSNCFGDILNSDFQINYKHYEEFIKKNNHFSLRETEEISIHLWIIRDNDGSNDYDSNQAIDSLNQALKYFDGTGFTFAVCKISTFNDSSLDTFNFSTDHGKIIPNHFNPSAINWYINKSGVFHGRLLNGNALAPEYGREGISLFFTSHKGTNRQTIAHELGHVLGLKHTHGNYNDYINDCYTSGSYNTHPDFPKEVFCGGAVRYDNNPTLDDNDDQIPDCMQTGDFVCDTPADPYLSGLIKNDCIYREKYTDYYGDLYKPDTKNIMSYSGNECYQYFTQGQKERMAYIYQVHFGHLKCKNCNQSISTSDTTMIVTNLNDYGPGSLRQTMFCARLHRGKTKIVFDPNIVNNIMTPFVSLPGLNGKNIEIDGRINDKNLVIDGSNLDPTSKIYCVMTPTIVSSTNDGNLIPVENIKISNIEFQNFSINIFSCYSGAKNITLEGLKFENNDYRYPVSINNVQDIEVVGCRFSNCGSVASLAFQNASNILLNNNTIENAANSGIEIRGSNSNFKFIKNEFKNNHSYIRFTQPSVNKIEFYGNKFEFEENIVGSDSHEYNNLNFYYIEGIDSLIIGSDEKTDENTFYNVKVDLSHTFSKELRTFKRNKMICSKFNGVNSITPKFTILNATTMSGTSNKKGDIYIYRQSQCANWEDQTITNWTSSYGGNEFVAKVSTDDLGNWSYNHNLDLMDGETVLICQVTDGFTSDFRGNTYSCDSKVLRIASGNYNDSDNICQGDTITLEAINFVNPIQWNNGSTSPIIKVNKEGEYFFTSKLSEGCTGVASKFIIIDDTLSINGIVGGNEFISGSVTRLSAKYQGARFEDISKFIWSVEHGTVTKAIDSYKDLDVDVKWDAGYVGDAKICVTAKLYAFKCEVRQYCTTVQIKNIECKVPSELLKPSIKLNRLEFEIPQNVANITEYIIEWGEADLIYNERDTIELSNINSYKYVIEELVPCTRYKVRVAPKCGNSVMAFGAPKVFTTLGCNEEYCLSYGNASWAYIDQIQFDNIILKTGSDLGYGDYTDSVIFRFVKGQTGTFSFDGVFSEFYNNYVEVKNNSVEVWIDFDRDGDFEFDPPDIVLDPDMQDTIFSLDRWFSDYSENLSSFETEYEVPNGNWVKEGLTRMRIVYNGRECTQEGSPGETEDYLIEILGAVATVEENLEKIVIFPNPATDEVFLRLPNINEWEINFYSFDGKKVLKSSNSTKINVSDLFSGIYILEVVDKSKGLRYYKKLVLQK